MDALVVYESMYGNTHEVAEAIGRGLATECGVRVVPVSAATPASVERVDLLVVGGPTHVHGMSWASTRRSAIDDVHNADRHLDVDRDAAGDGLREWFDEFAGLDLWATAFDTRLNRSANLTGRASKGIAKHLRRLGCRAIAEPVSFVVDPETRLVAGELERAERWGQELGAILAAPRSDASLPSH